MARHARIHIEEPEADSEAGMAHRENIARLLEARMTKPATAAEERLWQEFKADLERNRPRFH